MSKLSEGWSKVEEFWSFSIRGGMARYIPFYMTTYELGTLMMIEVDSIRGSLLHSKSINKIERKVTVTPSRIYIP